MHSIDILGKTYRQKQLVNENLQKMYSPAPTTKVPTKDELEKSVKDTLNTVFEKGEIADSLASGYGAGSQAVTFTKTGKEIKEKIPGILAALQVQKGILEAKLSGLKTQVGIDPTRTNTRKYSQTTPFNRYEYNLCEPAYVNGAYEDATDQNTWCRQYNDLVYVYCDVCDDIDAMEIMNNNLEEKKKYTLSVSQLIALNFN